MAVKRLGEIIDRKQKGLVWQTHFRLNLYSYNL